MKILISNDGVWLRKDAAGWNPLKRVWRNIKEWAFDDYREAMDNLRKVDAEIREWADGLKHFIKEAKKAKREGRHLDVITWLNEINQRLRFISAKGKSVEDLADEQIKRFYGQHQEAVVNPHENIVQAGFMDDAKRWLATRQLREQYKDKVKGQRLAIENILSLCERTVNTIERNLNEMEGFRRYGNIEEYIKHLKKISITQKEFEDRFLKVFDEFFAKEVARIRAQQAPVPLPAPSVPAVPIQPPPMDVTQPQQPIPEAFLPIDQPPKPLEGKEPPLPSIPPLPPVPTKAT